MTCFRACTSGMLYFLGRIFHNSHHPWADIFIRELWNKCFSGKMLQYIILVVNSQLSWLPAVIVITSGSHISFHCSFMSCEAQCLNGIVFCCIFPIEVASQCEASSKDLFSANYEVTWDRSGLGNSEMIWSYTLISWGYKIVVKYIGVTLVIALNAGNFSLLGNVVWFWFCLCSFPGLVPWFGKKCFGYLQTRKIPDDPVCQRGIPISANSILLLRHCSIFLIGLVLNIPLQEQ